MWFKAIRNGEIFWMNNIKFPITFRYRSPGIGTSEVTFGVLSKTGKLTLQARALANHNFCLKRWCKGDCSRFEPVFTVFFFLRCTGTSVGSQNEADAVQTSERRNTGGCEWLHQYRKRSMCVSCQWRKVCKHLTLGPNLQCNGHTSALKNQF